MDAWFVGNNTTEKHMIIKHEIEIDGYTYPVTKIADNALKDCHFIEGVIIPDSVTAIGNNAFRGCVRLTELLIPDGVSSIGASAFKNTALTEIHIPQSVSYIGGNAFENCNELFISLALGCDTSNWDANWNIDNCTVWGH